MKSQVDILKARLEREINARKQAEQLLEEKALALFDANLALKKLNSCEVDTLPMVFELVPAHGRTFSTAGY